MILYLILERLQISIYENNPNAQIVTLRQFSRNIKEIGDLLLKLLNTIEMNPVYSLSFQLLCWPF